jgi:hypothetical protein
LLARTAAEQLRIDWALADAKRPPGSQPSAEEMAARERQAQAATRNEDVQHVMDNARIFHDAAKDAIQTGIEEGARKGAQSMVKSLADRMRNNLYESMAASVTGKIFGKGAVQREKPFELGGNILDAISYRNRGLGGLPTTGGINGAAWRAPMETGPSSVAVIGGMVASLAGATNAVQSGMDGATFSNAQFNSAQFIGGNGGNNFGGKRGMSDAQLGISLVQRLAGGRGGLFGK